MSTSFGVKVMSGDVQLARMKATANAEIIRAAALIAKLRQEGKVGLHDAATMLAKASTAYRAENYYLAWEYAKIARSTAEKIMGGIQVTTPPVPMIPSGQVVVTEGAASADQSASDYWKEESVSEAAVTQADTAYQRSAYTEPEQQSYQKAEYQEPQKQPTQYTYTPQYSSSSTTSQTGENRTHCKNCKSRITPVEKFMGGYKCPVCGADVEGL